MRIAVTGASGHLGQWVVSRLTASGHDVLCVSPSPTTRPDIRGLAWPRPVGTLVCDLTDPSAVGRLRDGLADVEAVAHLAAFVPADTSSGSIDDALATLRANVMGTCHLLQALSGARRLGALVHAGSFEVYGPPRALPIREDHPLEPTSCYGAGKLGEERYVALFGAARGVPCCTLRLPAVYGPGETAGRAVGDFVRAAAEGRPIEMCGDGEDRRDLVYVDDAARAFVLALERGATGAFNLGSGRGFAIREIAEAVASLEGVSVPIVRRERVEPRLDCILDITHAKGALGWEPATALSDVLRAQLAWVRPD